MESNCKQLKKQITGKVEQNIFVFFVPEISNSEQIKTILSVSVPGYPPHFTLDWFENQKTDCVTEKKSSIDISIIIAPDTSINLLDNLIISPKLENEIFKRIKTTNGFINLNAKTDSVYFSNPYGMLSFEYYMEENFKKIKSKSCFSQKARSTLPNICFQSIINFSLKWFCSGFFFISKISLKNSTKVLCALIFIEILTIKKSISVSEVFLKLVFKIWALRIIEIFVNFKRLFSVFNEKARGSFEKKTRIETEISTIKTLINGLIRSGNLFAV